MLDRAGENGEGRPSISMAIEQKSKLLLPGRGGDENAELLAKESSESERFRLRMAILSVQEVKRVESERDWLCGCGSWINR